MRHKPSKFQAESMRMLKDFCESQGLRHSCDSNYHDDRGNLFLYVDMSLASLRLKTRAVSGLFSFLADNEDRFWIYSLGSPNLTISTRKL